MSKSKSDEQTRPVWLLCEGLDCKMFFIRVLEKLGLRNIYCQDSCGINDEDVFKNVPLASNFQNVKTLVYIRDAEYPKNQDAVKRKLHIAFTLSDKVEIVGARTGQAVLHGGLDLDN